MAARSYLYVPGDQPEKLAKAGTRDADAVIVDLEDAVTPGRKEDLARVDSATGLCLAEARAPGVC